MSSNFIDDFKNQDRIIIGGPRPAATRVRQLFYKAFPTAHIIKTSSTIAEMVKYTTNTFLSVKVSFANEIKEICDKVGVDYDKVTEYATYDDRLGAQTMHLKDIWNGVSFQKTEWDGKLSTALEMYNKQLSSYSEPAREQYTLRDDWIVVTVDYHS